MVLLELLDVIVDALVRVQRTRASLWHWIGVGDDIAAADSCIGIVVNPFSLRLSLSGAQT